MLKRACSLFIIATLICMMVPTTGVLAEFVDKVYDFNTPIPALPYEVFSVNSQHVAMVGHESDGGASGELGDGYIKVRYPGRATGSSGAPIVASNSGRNLHIYADDSQSGTITGQYVLCADYQMGHEYSVAGIGFKNGPYTTSFANTIIYFYKGGIYLSQSHSGGANITANPEKDEKLAEPGIGVWFNLGLVFDVTPSGTGLDIFYNRELVKETTISNLIDFYRTTITPHSSLDGSDSLSGHYTGIDNLYTGRDVTKVLPDFSLVATYPADGDTNAPPVNKITLNFSSAVGDLTMDAFEIPGAEIIDIYPTDASQTEIVLVLDRQLQNDTEYTLSIDKSKLMSSFGVPLSEDVVIRFNVGSDKGVMQDISFYLLDDDGEEVLISQPEIGHIRTKISVTDWADTGDITIIGLKCVGTEEYFRIADMQVLSEAIYLGDTIEAVMDFNLEADEFIKILVWKNNEGSLINLTEPTGL